MYVALMIDREDDTEIYMLGLYHQIRNAKNACLEDADTQLSTRFEEADDDGNAVQPEDLPDKSEIKWEKNGHLAMWTGTVNWDEDGEIGVTYEIHESSIQDERTGR